MVNKWTRISTLTNRDSLIHTIYPTYQSDMKALLVWIIIQIKVPEINPHWRWLGATWWRKISVHYKVDCMRSLWRTEVAMILWAQYCNQRYASLQQSTTEFGASPLHVVPRAVSLLAETQSSEHDSWRERDTKKWTWFIMRNACTIQRHIHLIGAFETIALDWGKHSNDSN